MCSSDIFLGLLAILFPPIAVWIKRGLCSADSILNILLCILGYIPGLIHAWYIIARYPDEAENGEYRIVDGNESGRGQGQERVTYYYVAQGSQRGHGSGNGHHGQRDEQRGYGTNSNGNVQRGLQQQPGPAQAQGGSSQSGEGVPPSYQEAVRGDNKVQT